ncbi:MAG: response regulator [Lachnospiraceae bacterium]|nr:response regulator [Lachnospiraceae bacterium]
MTNNGQTEKMKIEERMMNFLKFAFALILACLMGLIVYFCSKDRSDPVISGDPVYIEEWTITDSYNNVIKGGTSHYNGSGKRGTFTMASRLPEKISDGSDFCFIVGGNATVFINGNFRKDFNEDRDIILPGGCVKRFYMVVPLTAEDSGAPIQIVRHNTSRSGYLYQDTFVTTGSGLLPYLMTRYGLSFMLAEILFLLALVIVIASIIMNLVYRQRIGMMYGALSIVIIASWIISNSYLCPFVYGHFHIDGIVNYFCSMMMPYNLIFYLDSLQRGRYRKVMVGLVILTTLNLLACSILHFTEIMVFPRTLPYHDAVLGVLILAVIVIFIIEIVRGNIKEYRYTAIGFGFFIACGILEIMALNFIPVLNNNLLMMTGLALLLLMIVVQQIADLRKIRDERQKAIDLSETKTKFLASMSHEIRTPINAILGMNEMIIRENRDDTINEYAQSVKSSGRMLLMLVNDVLDFSKIEAGKMEISNTEFSMSLMLRDIMPMLKERADEKNLKLETKIVSEVPDGLISDEFRIRQILINIINNAIKYTDTGSVTLSVGGEYNGEDEFLLKFSIKDTGRGIKEEDQKHLFEAFTRADVKKNRNIEGTGLGLAIVKSIVDSMGGEISVKSKYLEGSDFMIDLKTGIHDRTLLKEDFMESRHVEDPGTADCDYIAPDAVVLAVDDNGMNLKIAKYFLNLAGIEPDLCSNGTKAVELCREKKYDLILLDHMMPDPDGIETLKMIRNDDRSLNKDTVSIVLTANALSDSRKTYMEAGFEDYLTKPIDAMHLVMTVKKYLPEEKIRPTEE